MGIKISPYIVDQLRFFYKQIYVKVHTYSQSVLQIVLDILMKSMSRHHNMYNIMYIYKLIGNKTPIKNVKVGLGQKQNWGRRGWNGDFI